MRFAWLLVVSAIGCASSASRYQPLEPTELDTVDDKGFTRAPKGQLDEPASQEETPAAVKSETLVRADLEQVLDAGPGAFLARVEVRPHFDGKRFAGWELVSFVDPNSRLAGSGLQVGDVVKSVNRRKLERPEHLQKLWRELRSAPAIVVKGTRAGESFELRFAVSGRVSGEASSRPKTTVSGS